MMAINIFLDMNFFPDIIKMRPRTELRDTVGEIWSWSWCSHDGNMELGRCNIRNAFIRTRGSQISMMP